MTASRLKLITAINKTCPFAQRAWIALLETGVAFDERQIDLANKPQDFLDLYRTLNPDPDAKAVVPILHGEVFRVG